MYHERVRWPFWSHLLFLLPCALGLLGLAWAIRRGEAWSWDSLSFLVLISIGYVWWRMRYLKLEFGPDGAAFGFSGLRRRVPRDRIVSAAPEEYSASRYMGWGYRFGWGERDRAYSVIGYSRGVRIEFDDERGRRWKVFLSSARPEDAIQALKP